MPVAYILKVPIAFTPNATGIFYYPILSKSQYFIAHIKAKQ